MSAAAKPRIDESKPARLEQLLAVLDPVIRIAVKNGIDPGEFLALAREAVIDVAHDHSSSLGVDAHIARLAIDSGLTQSEVRSALAAKKRREEVTEARRRMEETVTRVATVWTSDMRFSGPYGTALQLRIASLPPKGGTATPASEPSAVTAAPSESERGSGSLTEGATLEQLVYAVDPSANVEDVLFAMLDRGAVAWANEDQNSVVLSIGFHPVLEQGADPTFEYVTQTLAGLGRTLATNAYGLYTAPKLFERRAIGDRVLDERALRQVNEVLRSKLSTVLESVVDDLDAPKTSIESAAEGRCSVGVYVMAEPLSSRARPQKRSYVREIDLSSSNARASLNARANS